MQYKAHFLVALGIIALDGCSSAPKPAEPVPLSITIQASTQINPDNYGRPSPLKLVFYELKSPVTFETADFFSLSQRDQAVIGPDLLGKEEFFVRPGETRTLSRKGFPDTTALGVFVEFRDIDKSIWHASATVPTAERAGFFSTIAGAMPGSTPPQKNYRIAIDQHSVKFVSATTPADTTDLAPKAPAPVSNPPSPTQDMPTSLPAKPTLSH
jgi:type VI secretion system protein VasD